MVRPGSDLVNVFIFSRAQRFKVVTPDSPGGYVATLRAARVAEQPPNSPARAALPPGTGPVGPPDPPGTPIPPTSGAKKYISK